MTNQKPSVQAIDDEQDFDSELANNTAPHKDDKNLADLSIERLADGSYSPNAYINRELSTLQFQLRVLAQAKNTRMPLLERMFFLMVFSSNMDEFFEIRVAGLLQKIKQNNDLATSLDGLKPSQVVEEISRIAHVAVDEQYRILNEEILRAGKK